MNNRKKKEKQDGNFFLTRKVFQLFGSKIVFFFAKFFFSKNRYLVSRFNYSKCCCCWSFSNLYFQCLRAKYSIKTQQSSVSFCNAISRSHANVANDRRRQNDTCTNVQMGIHHPDYPRPSIHLSKTCLETIRNGNYILVQGSTFNHWRGQRYELRQICSQCSDQ